MPIANASRRPWLWLVLLVAAAGAFPAIAASPEFDPADVTQMRETPACPCRSEVGCGPCEGCIGCTCTWRVAGECIVPVGQGEAETCGSFGRCVLDWQTCLTACVFDTRGRARAVARGAGAVQALRRPAQRQGPVLSPVASAPRIAR